MPENLTETTQPGVVHKKLGTREIAYKPEFKQFVRENPGALKKAKDLLNGMGTSEEEKESDGMRLKRMYGGNSHFQLDFGDRKFFVKKYWDPDNSHDSAAKQILASQEAISRLQKNKIDWAEVVDFQFGFHGGNYSYYVANWDDRLVHPVQDNGELAQPVNLTWDIREKMKKLEDLLPDYYDLRLRNIAYDPKNRKIILFDLAKTPIKPKNPKLKIT